MAVENNEFNSGAISGQIEKLLKDMEVGKNPKLRKMIESAGNRYQQIMIDIEKLKKANEKADEKDIENYEKISNQITQDVIAQKLSATAAEQKRAKEEKEVQRAKQARDEALAKKAFNVSVAFKDEIMGLFGISQAMKSAVDVGMMSELFSQHSMEKLGSIIKEVSQANEKDIQNEKRKGYEKLTSGLDSFRKAIQSTNEGARNAFQAKIKELETSIENANKDITKATEEFSKHDYVAKQADAEIKSLDEKIESLKAAHSAMLSELSVGNLSSEEAASTTASLEKDLQNEMRPLLEAKKKQEERRQAAEAKRKEAETAEQAARDELVLHTQNKTKLARKEWHLHLDLEKSFGDVAKAHEELSKIESRRDKIETALEKVQFMLLRAQEEGNQKKIKAMQKGIAKLQDHNASVLKRIKEVERQKDEYLASINKEVRVWQKQLEDIGTDTGTDFGIQEKVFNDAFSAYQKSASDNADNLVASFVKGTGNVSEEMSVSAESLTKELKNVSRGKILGGLIDLKKPIEKDTHFGRALKGFYNAREGFRKQGLKGFGKGLLKSAGNDVHRSIRNWQESGGLGAKVFGWIADKGLKFARQKLADKKYSNAVKNIQDIEKRIAIYPKGYVGSPSALEREKRLQKFRSVIGGLKTAINYKHHEDLINIDTYGQFTAAMNGIGSYDASMVRTESKKIADLIQKSNLETDSVYSDTKKIKAVVDKWIKSTQNLSDEEFEEYKNKASKFKLESETAVKKAAKKAEAAQESRKKIGLWNWLAHGSQGAIDDEALLNKYAGFVDPQKTAKRESTFVGPPKPEHLQAQLTNAPQTQGQPEQSSSTIKQIAPAPQGQAVPAPAATPAQQSSSTIKQVAPASQKQASGSEVKVEQTNIAVVPPAQEEQPSAAIVMHAKGGLLKSLAKAGAKKAINVAKGKIGSAIKKRLPPSVQGYLGAKKENELFHVSSQGNVTILPSDGSGVAQAKASLGGNAGPKMQYESAQAVEERQAQAAHLASIDKNVQLIADLLQKQKGGKEEKKKGLLESILDGLLALAGMIPGLMGALNFLKKGLSKLGDFAKSGLKKAADLAKSGLKKAGDLAKGGLKKAGDLAKSDLKKAGDLAKKSGLKNLLKGGIKAGLRGLGKGLGIGVATELLREGITRGSAKLLGLNEEQREQAREEADAASLGYGRNDDLWDMSKKNAEEMQRQAEQRAQDRHNRREMEKAGIKWETSQGKEFRNLTNEEIKGLSGEDKQNYDRWADTSEGRADRERRSFGRLSSELKEKNKGQPTFEERLAKAKAEGRYDPETGTIYKSKAEMEAAKSGTKETLNPIPKGAIPKDDWVAARMAQLGLDKQRKANPDAAIEAKLKLNDYNVAKTKFRHIYADEHGLLKDGKGVMDPKYKADADAQFNEFWKKYQERQAGIIPEDMKSSEEIKAQLEEKNPINPILDAFDEFNKDNKEKLKKSEGLEQLPTPLVPPHVQPLGASPAPGITPSNPQQGSNDPKAYELRQFAIYAKQHGIQMNPDGTFALTPDQMKEARLIDLSKLPHYAEGGIVDPSRDGQLAVIGEGGEKEAVMPMSKLANFLLEAFKLKKSIDKESTAKMLESAKRALGLGGEDRSKLGTQFTIENAITDIQKNVESIYKMMRYIKVDGVALGDYLDNKPNAAAAKAGLTQPGAGAGGPGGSPAGAGAPSIPGVPAAGPSGGPVGGAGGGSGGDAGGGTQQFVPQAGVSADGKRLGFIAMKRESGGNAAQVSGDTGNSHSYGLYQFNTGKNDSGGTMHTFVNYLAKNYSNLYQPLAGKRIGSKEFNAAFQQVASANRAQMEQAQEEHLKNAYYTPAVNELKKTPEGKEILSKYANDRAFQEMFISTAIQHGPAGAKSILSAAWNANPDKNSLKSFIGSVYNERGSARRFKTAMAEEAKKGRDPQKFLSNMQRQYKDEAGRVLGLLGQSAPTGGASPATPPAPAAPMQAPGGASPVTPPAPAAPMTAGPTIPGATGGSGLAGVAMGFGNFKYGMYKSGGGYARYNQLTKDASGRWVAGSKGGVATMDCSQYVSAVAANMGFEKWAKGGATAEVMRQDLKGNGMRQSLNDVQEGDILFTVGGSKHTSGAGHVAVVVRDPNNPNQLMVAESTGSSRGGYNGGFKMTPLNQYVDWQAKRRGRQFGSGVQIYPSPMTGKAAPAGMQGTPAQDQAQSPGAAAAPAMGGGGPASPAAMGGGMPAGGMAGAAGAATGGMPFAMPQMPPSLLGALFGGFGGFGGQRGGGGIGSLFGGLGRGIGGLLGGLVGGVGSILGGIFGGIGSLFSGLFGGGKEEAPSPAGGGGILDFLMGGGTPSGGMQPGIASPMGAPAGPSPAPAAPMLAPTIPGVGGGGTTGPIRQLAMPQTGGKELVELSNEGDGKNPKAFLNAKGMRWQRNKNVGSIKALKGQSSDGRDRVFSTFSEGILEMHNLLGRNYFAKGQDTIESILYKYAPPSDGNNTEEYINFVCKKTGFQRNQKLNFNDSNQMAALQRAMIAFETSHQFKMDEIKGIYAAAGKQDGGTGTPQLSMPGQGPAGTPPAPAGPMPAGGTITPTPPAPPTPAVPGAGPAPASPSAGGTGGPMESMPTQQNQQPSLGGGGLAGRILGIARRRAGEAGKGGYSQDNRLASNQYDCSSFVARSLQEAGFDINPAEFNTRSMQTILPTKGFVFNRGLGGLQVGDILWRPGHTEIYAGNNRTIGAHSGRSGVSEYAYKGNLEQYTGYWRFKGQEALSQEQQAAISQEQGAIPQGGTPPTIPGQEGGNVQGQMQGVQQPDAGGAAGPAAGPQIQGSQQSNLADKASEFYSNGGGGGGANVNAPTTNIFGQGGDEKNGPTFITAKDPMSWVVLQGNCVH